MTRRLASFCIPKCVTSIRVKAAFDCIKSTFQTELLKVARNGKRKATNRLSSSRTLRRSRLRERRSPSGSSRTIRTPCTRPSTPTTTTAARAAITATRTTSNLRFILKIRSGSAISTKETSIQLPDSATRCRRPPTSWRTSGTRTIPSRTFPPRSGSRATVKR